MYHKHAFKLHTHPHTHGYRFLLGCYSHISHVVGYYHSLSRSLCLALLLVLAMLACRVCFLPIQLFFHGWGKRSTCLFVYNVLLYVCVCACKSCCMKRCQIHFFLLSPLLVMSHLRKSLLPYMGLFS